MGSNNVKQNDKMPKKSILKNGNQETRTNLNKNNNKPKKTRIQTNRKKELPRKKNKSTNLNDDEMKNVKKYFMQASGGDRVINFQDFVELFGLLFPQYIGPNLISIAERAFMTIDTNFDGHLT